VSNLCENNCLLDDSTEWQHKNVLLCLTVFISFLVRRPPSLSTIHSINVYFRHKPRAQKNIYKHTHTHTHQQTHTYTQSYTRIAVWTKLLTDDFNLVSQIRLALKLTVLKLGKPDPSTYEKHYSIYGTKEAVFIHFTYTEASFCRDPIL